VFRDTVIAARSLGHDVETLVSDGRRTALSYLLSLRWFIAMSKTLKEFEPDIVHVQNYYRFLSPSVLLALRLYRRKHPLLRVVFTAHDYHLVCPNSGFQHFPRGVRTTLDTSNPRVPTWASYDQRSRTRAFLKSFQHLVAYRLLKLDRTFDLIIAPSDFLKQIFERCGVRTPIVLIRNPVAFPLGPPIGGSKHGDLVYMGRVAPEKGLREFMLALEAEAQEVTVDIYGDGDDWHSLNALSLKLHHVALTMHKPVPRDQVPATLAKYTALIYPSIWPENAPIVVIEAIVNGLPVVVPKNSGALEMGNQGELVTSFTAGSYREVTAAVLGALEAPSVNRLLHPREFSSSSYAAALRSVYGRLLHGPHRAVPRQEGLHR
jgi:glycosyltransferase involved in cell wall biosynthesis